MPITCWHGIFTTMPHQPAPPFSHRVSRKKAADVLHFDKLARLAAVRPFLACPGRMGAQGRRRNRILTKQNGKRQMKKDIRVIGLDLDGTTLNSKKQLTPRVAEAIARATAAGIAVVPVTGRNLAGVPEEFISIPGVRYAITSNGAAVYDLAPGAAGAPQLIDSDCFSKADALSLLEKCRSLDMVTLLFHGGAGHTEDLRTEELEKLFSPEMMDYLLRSNTVVENLDEVILGSEALAEKFSLVFFSPAERIRAINHFTACPICSVTSATGANLELNTPTADKGKALLALAKRLRCRPQQVMAVGDGHNDIGMLKVVGFPVAMENAVPEVKKVAGMTTLSADRDGVALVIESVLGMR